MILPDGTEIPDPPEDPEERRAWKIKYHTVLYRLPDQMKKTMKKILKEMFKDDLSN